MPRPSGLIAALAGVLSLASPGNVAAQPHCTRSLTLSERSQDPAMLALKLDAPCDPYAALTLGYGPLEIVQQASALGTLVLDLPRLAGVDDLKVALASVEVFVPVPPSTVVPPGFAAVTWADDRPWGTLAVGALAAPATRYRLGFDPADGTARTDLIVSDGPVALRVPILLDTCGSTRTALVGTDAHSEPQPLTLTLPGCEAVGQVVEIPLR